MEERRGCPLDHTDHIPVNDWRDGNAQRRAAAPPNSLGWINRPLLVVARLTLAESRVAGGRRRDRPTTNRW